MAKVRHDILKVSYDSSLKGEVGLCVARVIGDEVNILKMELGEQADILYRLLTEQMTKAVIKEGEDILDNIKTEMHATAEKHEDGCYYLREKWINEIVDKYKSKKEVEA